MKSGVRISSIASFLPEKRRVTELEAVKFECEPGFLENKIGTTSLSVKDDTEDTSDLCVKAAEALASSGEYLNDVGVIVVCTQSPDGHGIPHTSAIVHSKLGLKKSCACFDISLGCSGYVYGLSVVSSFMEANSIRRGLFFTCDPYSKIIDPEDKATALLFGDAATVTLLTMEGPGYSIVESVFATNGSGGSAINNRSGKLQMDGREVFNFALTAVPTQINELLDKANVGIADVDSFVFHQGSRFMVEKIRQRMRIDDSKAPVFLSGFGNTVSSAVPITLEKVLSESSPKRIVICGFGVGLSYASSMLERR
ncbi:MAG: ketoacyl-ACP synthase III [Verrucomicrobiales bacterium]|nr:ketoacyl-ACP synthase III [Verrucomicrobiales bacterium]